MNAMAAPIPKRAATSGIQQPKSCPTFRCRPARVKGIPVCRAIRPFRAESPTARFQENENPYLRIAITL